MSGATMQKRWRRGRWALMAGIVLVSVGVLMFTAIGLFTGSDFKSHTATAGKVQIDLDDPANGAALTVASTALAPTDIIERVVDLNVSGNVSVTALTLTTTATATSALDTDATHGLQLKIDECSDGWDPDNTGVHPYECGSGGSGTPTVVLASRAVIGANLALNNMNLSGITHLKITMTFAGGSADDDVTFAGEPSSTIKFTFSGTQRSQQYK